MIVVRFLHCILTEFRWSQAGDALETAVEVRQGIETDLKGHLADVYVWVPQNLLGVFYAQPGEVFGEVHPNMFLELLAEIKGADIQVIGDGSQADGFAVVFEEIFFGTSDEGWLRVAAVQKNPVGVLAELPGELGEKLEQGVLLFSFHHGTAFVGLLKLPEVRVQIPLG